MDKASNSTKSQAAANQRSFRSGPKTTQKTKPNTQTIEKNLPALIKELEKQREEYRKQIKLLSPDSAQHSSYSNILEKLTAAIFAARSLDDFKNDRCDGSEQLKPRAIRESRESLEKELAEIKQLVQNIVHLNSKQTQETISPPQMQSCGDKAGEFEKGNLVMEFNPAALVAGKLIIEICYGYEGHQRVERKLEGTPQANSPKTKTVKFKSKTIPYPKIVGFRQHQKAQLQTAEEDHGLSTALKISSTKIRKKSPFQNTPSKAEIIDHLSEFNYVASDDLHQLVTRLPGNLQDNLRILKIGNCSSISDYLAYHLQDSSKCGVITGKNIEPDGKVFDSPGHAQFVFVNEENKLEVIESTAYCKKSFVNLKLSDKDFKELENWVTKAQEARAFYDANKDLVQEAILLKMKESLDQILEKDKYRDYHLKSYTLAAEKNRRVELLEDRQSNELAPDMLEQLKSLPSNELAPDILEINQKFDALCLNKLASPAITDAQMTIPLEESANELTGKQSPKLLPGVDKILKDSEDVHISLKLYIKMKQAGLLQGNIHLKESMLGYKINPESILATLYTRFANSSNRPIDLVSKEDYKNFAEKTYPKIYKLFEHTEQNPRKALIANIRELFDMNPETIKEHFAIQNSIVLVSAQEEADMKEVITNFREDTKPLRSLSDLKFDSRSISTDPKFSDAVFLPLTSLDKNKASSHLKRSRMGNEREWDGLTEYIHGQHSARDISHRVSAKSDRIYVNQYNHHQTQSKSEKINIVINLRYSGVAIRKSTIRFLDHLAKNPNKYNVNSCHLYMGAIKLGELNPKLFNNIKKPDQYKELLRKLININHLSVTNKPSPLLISRGPLVLNYFHQDLPFDSIIEDAKKQKAGVVIFGHELDFTLNFALKDLSEAGLTQAERLNLLEDTIFKLASLG